MALTITIPGGSVQLAGSKVWIKVNSDTVQGSHYEILLKATSENGLIQGSPFDEGITPDANGDVWFELSDLFWRSLVPGFNYGNNTLHTEYDNLVETVAFDIGESYIDASNGRQENWAGLAGDQYKVVFLNGFLTQDDQNQLTEDGTTFYAEYIQGGKFLSSLVNGMTIFPGQDVKLWWFPSTTVQQVLSAKADYTLQDGTQGTVSTDVTINPGMMSEFDVDPETLGLPSDASNPVVAYTFYLADGATLASEQFSFVVDNEYYEYKTNVYYQNKYGLVDCVCFTGYPDYGYPVERSFGQRQPTSSDDTRQRTRVSTGVTGRHTRNLPSGYKSFDEILAMEALLSSELVWIPNGSKLLPVNIENSDELLISIFDDQDAHKINLKLTEAH